MKPLEVFPCRLVREGKHTRNLGFQYDVELDRIMLSNEIARTARSASSSGAVALTSRSQDEYGSDVHDPRPLRT